MSKTKAELQAENDALRDIAADLQWMARRYANESSAMGYWLANKVNKYTSALLKAGAKLNPCGEKQIFARGDKRTLSEWSGIDADLRQTELDYLKRKEG